MLNRLFKSVLSVLAGGLLFMSSAAADWPEKEITFVIPYSTGGGMDGYVRALSPAMEKVLGVPVVPTNMPGAGGNKGAAYTYRADPDGYTLSIFNIPGMTVSQVLGEPIGYDLEKVSWVGDLGTERYAIAVRGESDIKSIDDLMSLDRTVKFSATGPGSTAYVTTTIAANILGLDHQIVTGYKGTKEVVLAVLRGDVDGTFRPISSLLKYHETGDMRIILTLETDGSLEGVPSAADIGKPGLAKLTLERMIGAPPGLPPEIHAKLSDALVKAAMSPEVQEWAKSTNRPMNPIGHKEATELMQEIMTFYVDYKDILK